MSTAVDVWGLACAMWEAVTRKDLPGEHPVLGERAVEADDWQKEIKSLLMPDFEDGLGEMIHAEIEAELGRAGLEELKHQLGLAETPKLVEDAHSANPWAVLQASDANDEQEEIRATVASYLTVRGLSAPATSAIPTQHVNDAVFLFAGQRTSHRATSQDVSPPPYPQTTAQNCACTPVVQEQGAVEDFYAWRHGRRER